MQESSIANAIIYSVIGPVRKKLSIDQFVSYPIKIHFVYTEEEVLVPMMSLILELGGKQIYAKSMLRDRRVLTHHYGLMDLMPLTLIQLPRSDQIKG